MSERVWPEPTEEQKQALRVLVEASRYTDPVFDYMKEVGLAATCCSECGGNGYTVTWTSPPEQECCPECDGIGFDFPQALHDIVFPPYVPDPDFIKTMSAENPDVEPLF